MLSDPCGGRQILRNLQPGAAADQLPQTQYWSSPGTGSTSSWRGGGGGTTYSWTSKPRVPLFHGGGGRGQDTHGLAVVPVVQDMMKEIDPGAPRTGWVMKKSWTWTVMTGSKSATTSCAMRRAMIII